MSLLHLSCATVGNFDLRVTQFSSALVGNLVSSQTKYALHHFPIKADQQNIQFNVIFNGWPEYQRMQDYVRKHMIRALTTVENPEVVLNWPERNIVDWSGVIQNFRGGDERFNIAPKAQITFLLVDSLLSQKTWTSSFGEDYLKWFQTDIGDVGDIPGLTPPAAPPGFGGAQGEGSVDITPPAQGTGTTRQTIPWWGK